LEKLIKVTENNFHREEEILKAEIQKVFLFFSFFFLFDKNIKKLHLFFFYE